MTLEERVERIERAAQAYAEIFGAGYGREHGLLLTVSAMNAFVNVMMEEPPSRPDPWVKSAI